ncbi:four helix bundle protein [Mongoliibacter ruber]|uniref:Four helix bundle protein n=1 Tax=Mongoliibacter ruber TaxID=1750599 RepID=A0A2T0WQA5_9BACT|nr:four helix bundle protein [Mongoliibacter ruber]
MSKIIKKFPIEEKYALTHQVKRASRSITNNIAEGFGRFFYQENIQFCRIARGSLAETLDHIIIAHDENYISDEEFAEFRTLNNECLKLLNGYISYLKKSKIQNS